MPRVGNVKFAKMDGRWWTETLESDKPNARVVDARWTELTNMWALRCCICDHCWEKNASHIDMNDVKCPGCGAVSDGNKICEAVADGQT